MKGIFNEHPNLGSGVGSGGGASRPAQLTSAGEDVSEYGDIQLSRPNGQGADGGGAVRATREPVRRGDEDTTPVDHADEQGADLGRRGYLALREPRARGGDQEARRGPERTGHHPEELISRLYRSAAVAGGSESSTEMTL
jgi:hypothetical protein